MSAGGGWHVSEKVRLITNKFGGAAHAVPASHFPRATHIPTHSQRWPYSVRAIPRLSVAELEDEDYAVTATDLLAYDEEQVVAFLKTQDRGGDLIFRVLLVQAALLLPLGIDELHTRLQNVASTRDDSSDLAPSRLQSDSIVSTPPLVAFEKLQRSSLQELIRDGGRPVRSIQQLSYIFAAPMARYEAVLPWLSDFPDSETGAGEIKTHSRGLGDTEVGFSAFLEASKRKYKGMGLKAMVSDPSFDETIRRQWQQMPASQPPESQTFSVYHNALRKDPQKQTAWTDWLEYLSFELSCLEILTLTAESQETEYHQSMRKLLRANQTNGNNAASSSAASDPMQTQQRYLGGKGVNMAKELAAAQADRDASRTSIDDFTRETETYT
ncbi:MAG: hypothetical protein Q9194_004891 [Teloschistes cf. exilis]